jgi:hypothetical protein
MILARVSPRKPVFIAKTSELLIAAPNMAKMNSGLFSWYIPSDNLSFAPGFFSITSLFLAERKKLAYCMDFS